MGKVVGGMTISLDGFFKGRDGNTVPLNPAFDELLNSEIMQEVFATTGSVVMGRTSYEMCQGDFTDYEFQLPLFILTHSAPTTVAKGANDKLSFTFVTAGVESAIRQAKAAAGDKDVCVVGGAITLQECLRKGVIDELQIDIMPVLLGDGSRFLEHLESEQIKLEKVKAVDLPGGGTHLRFRVLK